MQKSILAIILLVCSLATVYAQGSIPINTKVLRINISSLDEARNLLDEITDGNISKSIFDEVENDDIEINLFRLNNEFESISGFKILFMKNIMPYLDGRDNYYFNISYSDLSLEYKNDYNDNLYRNTNGSLSVDSYFRSENIIRVITEETKEKNVYYWQSTGGYTNLSIEDIKKTISISGMSLNDSIFFNIGNDLSSIEANNYYFQNVSKDQSDMFSNLNNDIIPLESESKRKLIFGKKLNQLTISKKSNLLDRFLPFANVTSDKQLKYRFVGGYERKTFRDSKYGEVFIEAQMKSKNFDVKLKYAVPQIDDKKFLRSLPTEFRNLKRLEKIIEPTVWLTFEAKFKS